MLTPEAWKKVNQLFDRALEEDTTHFLNHEEGEIAQEVRSLLAAHQLAKSFLQTPAGRAPARPRELETGEVIGDFWILKKLGAGSLATVYLADQLSLGRKVALKVAPNIGEEGRNMAPLEHDNIVRIFAEVVEAQNNLRWTCMQFVPGLSLEGLLQRLKSVAPEELGGRAILNLLDENAKDNTALDPAALRDRESLSDLDYLDACLWIASRIAQALDYAHRRGVLHLDVKPGNILINPYGRPLLTDFNVSQRGEGSQPVRGGTLNYMSPEQSQGFMDAEVLVDGRADIFSLGKVLEEMLALGPESSLEVEQCLKRCLAADPFQRLTASELVAHLESLLEQRVIERQLPAPGKWLEFARENRGAAILFFIFTPQVLGSIINITYNGARIVQRLTPLQQDAFEQFVIIYNLILYPFCAWLAWRQLSPVIRPSPRASLERKRQHLLSLPDWLVGICILGWMPGSILFPAFIHWRTGHLTPDVYGHFFVSFTLSCLIAMTYSFLYTHYLMVRVYYPCLWTGVRDIRRIAREELRHLPATLRLFYAMAGIIPLAGAALVLWTGYSSSAEFKILLTSLLAMGSLGLLLALRSSGMFAQTLFALTGERK